ncbi:hypothetical protein IFR05_013585 [Cadophora sp. M221]|nr:hypothetical protein IFR05_013585 [Cadophora sp. M221]
MASETISVPVQYLQWQPLYETERPFLRLFKPPPENEDDRATNLVFETKSVDLQDIRELETSPTLDSHGFQIVESATQITDFQNTVIVNEKYLAECEGILKATVGDADEVFCFDWRVRDSASQKSTNNVNTASKPATSTSGGMKSDDVERARAYDPENRAAMLSPALLVHIDYGVASVVSRIRLHFKENADRLLRGRFRVINFWRPLVNDVEDWPLAVCDGSTLARSDVIEADHDRETFSEVSLYCLSRESHRWYFQSHHRPDEALLVKIYDSDTDVKARYCPHTSVKLPNVPPEAPSRKSIEVRALVLAYPKDE